MSEPQPLDWEQYIDWSKGDLLDACCDPMLQGVDLGGRGRAPSSVDPSHMTLAVMEDNLSRSLPPRDQISHGPVSDENEQAVTIQPCEICASCGETFSDSRDYQRIYLLADHARTTGHLSWACKVNNCDRKFQSSRERNAHQKRPHVSGHGRVTVGEPHDCVECGESLSSKADLLRHAKELQHQPYACECGSSFSRLDVLNRHLEALGSDEPKYPCTYCKRHRGEDGFRRRDHLTQQIRNYHHLEIDDDPDRLQYNFSTCPHPDCPQFRDITFKQKPRSIQKKNKPFTTQSAFTKHMREEHNECTFPCDVSGCGRVGRRGYFREKDLLKHRREQHPDAAPYQVAKREVRVRCTELGCNALLDPSSLSWHTRTHKWRGQ